jgi:hypothetical protein
VSADEKKEKVVTFSGIADPKCKCTPEKLCRRCNPEPTGKYAAIIHQTPERFRGKFREPFADAVRKNNGKGGAR